MKNYWLDNSKSQVATSFLLFDYDDPSLDFFSAKMKIIQHMKVCFNLTNDDLSSDSIQELMSNWAYCADLLSQSRHREIKEQS